MICHIIHIILQQGALATDNPSSIGLKLQQDYPGDLSQVANLLTYWRAAVADEEGHLHSMIAHRLNCPRLSYCISDTRHAGI